jgi:TldD protein
MIQVQELTAPLAAAPGADPLTIVQRHLLEPAGLDLAVLDRAMSELMARRLDYGDLYFQSTRYESWAVEDGRVKEGVFSIDQGVGVRAVVGEKTGFAYADQLDAESLLDAAEAARGIAKSGGEGRVKVAAPTRGHALYPAVDPLPTLDDARKVELLISTAMCASSIRA